MRTALTIAGSDSSGGAGIQADIKTMITNGVYAMSAITALTAQNTTGVQAILNVTPEFLGQELDSVFQDIYPEAVKIGMVSDKDLIHVIAEKLKQYKAENIVVDPVMVATSGAKLISDDAVEILKQELFPLADVLTPNIPEAGFIVQIDSIFFFQCDFQKFLCDHMLHMCAFIFFPYFCTVNNSFIHRPVSSRNREGSRSFSYWRFT